MIRVCFISVGTRLTRLGIRAGSLRWSFALPTHLKHTQMIIPYGYGILVADLRGRYPLLYFVLKFIDFLIRTSKKTGSFYRSEQMMMIALCVEYDTLRPLDILGDSVYEAIYPASRL